jgi:hypothetical protein
MSVDIANSVGRIVAVFASLTIPVVPTPHITVDPRVDKK